MSNLVWPQEPFKGLIQLETNQEAMAFWAHKFVRLPINKDLRILPKELIWHRDPGLLTKAFRKLGRKFWLVLRPASIYPQPANRNQPAIWASPVEVRCPKWRRA